MQTEIFFPHGAALATRFSEPVDAMRRRPRQKRSRATIDSILDATAQVLDRRGWSGFTTNVVADVAGVSIGSLYQYFPNKLGLIEALRRRHFDDVRAALRAVTDSDPSPAMHIEAFVDGVIAAHSRHPGAHHAMLEEAPHSARRAMRMRRSLRGTRWGVRRSSSTVALQASLQSMTMRACRSQHGCSRQRWPVSCTMRQRRAFCTPRHSGAN
jgi:AcrR family transcriptional regulator